MLHLLHQRTDHLQDVITSSPLLFLFIIFKCMNGGKNVRRVKVTGLIRRQETPKSRRKVKGWNFMRHGRIISGWSWEASPSPVSCEKKSPTWAEQQFPLTISWSRDMTQDWPCKVRKWKSGMAGERAALLTRRLTEMQPMCVGKGEQKPPGT